MLRFLMLTFGVLAFVGLSPIKERGQPFDPVLWADTKAIQAPPYPRKRMMDDLLRNHLAVGMTKMEALALLGPPTDTGYFSGSDLVYWLGPEDSAFAIDSAWLLVDFDAADEIVSIRIATD